MKKALLRALLCLLISFPVHSKILVARLEGVINPPVVSYLVRAIEQAEKSKVPLIIEIDTPGGLLESTRVVVMRILNASIPVITYVYPSGARAASAGLFLLEAGHIAVMAPGTHAGAAHPVAFGQRLSKVMGEKVTNDAVAFLRSIASERGRYHRFLDKMVLESKTLTARQMLKRRLINFIAKDHSELLLKLSEKKVRVSGKAYTFHRNDELVHFPMSFKEKFLHAISHPSVAYIMLVLGFYGLLFELSNPGLIFPGVVGFVLLVLGFYSLHVLPLNYAGVALILFSFLLFLLEVKITSHGLLGVGGAVSFFLGSLMLFDKVPRAMKPSMSIIVGLTILTAIFFFFVVVAGVLALRKRPVSGREGLVGERGRAKSRIVPGSEGWVFVHGERWRAVSDEEIEEGEEVEVVEVRGLTLKVRRISDDSA